MKRPPVGPRVFTKEVSWFISYRNARRERGIQFKTPARGFFFVAKGEIERVRVNVQ